LIRVNISYTQTYISYVNLSILFENQWNFPFIMNEETWPYITRRDSMIKSPNNDRERWSIHLE
jgi:hypothetical protein